MQRAKTQFLERISSLRQSLEIEAVTNKSLAEDLHNRVARLLRNGLAVVGFTALEDFLKSRTSEVLDSVGSSGVPFLSLPEKLRDATTHGAISALAYQISIRTRSDRTTYVQEHAQKLASTASTAYELTPHALGYSQANLQDQSIKEILKAFSIADPWGQMTALGSRLGLVALPLDETFKSAALRRHRAAHVANADTPQNDLKQFVNESLAIAMGFDWLITTALKLLNTHDLGYIAGTTTPNVANMQIRSIRNHSGSWKEKLEHTARAVRVATDRDELVPLARVRAARNGDLLVVYSQNGEVEFWECC